MDSDGFSYPRHTTFAMAAVLAMPQRPCLQQPVVWNVNLSVNANYDTFSMLYGEANSITTTNN